jgi:hypothetical protein
MKKIVLLSLFAFPLILFSQNKTALFIGNSYTASNNSLPYWTSKIAGSFNDTLEYIMITPGGATLNQHSVNTQVLDSISSRAWDYVVLQEQSQLPSFPPSQVEEEVYPYAQILCDSIYSNNECTIPMFFMTWGRENGDQTNCQYYEPLCTYEGMQNRLRESYLEMAQINNAQVAPVGVVWKYLREIAEDTLELYSPDESHPSILGTYTAACTFYASMFHKSPVGAAYPPTVDADDALLIQQIAEQIVFDSLDVWQIDTTKVYAHFDQAFLVRGPEVYLQGYCINADSAFWDFGDGTDLWQYNDLEYQFITHNYPEYQNYYVCLTAYSGCKQDTYCAEVLGIDSNLEMYDSEIKVYPNPAKHSLFIEPNGKIIENICIVNQQGKTVKTVSTANSSNTKVDVKSLPQGLYVLKLLIDGQKLSYRFVIE